MNPEENFSRDYFASGWQVSLGTQQVFFLEESICNNFMIPV